jgi:hypothetical protein
LGRHDDEREGFDVYTYFLSLERLCGICMQRIYGAKDLGVDILCLLYKWYDV